MDALAPGSPASALVGPTIGDAIAAVMNKAEKIRRIMMSTSCNLTVARERPPRFNAKYAHFTARGDTTSGQHGVSGHRSCFPDLPSRAEEFTVAF